MELPPKTPKYLLESIYRQWSVFNAVFFFDLYDLVNKL